MKIIYIFGGVCLCIFLAAHAYIAAFDAIDVIKNPAFYSSPLCDNDERHLNISKGYCYKKGGGQ